jgi:hypothetical protein
VRTDDDGRFAVFENRPGIDPAPLLAPGHGQGAVPIWFVRTGPYEVATADGVITVGELAALDPLREALGQAASGARATRSASCERTRRDGVAI